MDLSSRKKSAWLFELDEESEGGLRAMIVLLLKHVHLQKDVAAARGERWTEDLSCGPPVRLKTTYRMREGDQGAVSKAVEMQMGDAVES